MMCVGGVGGGLSRRRPSGVWEASAASPAHSGGGNIYSGVQHARLRGCVVARAVFGGHAVLGVALTAAVLGVALTAGVLQVSPVLVAQKVCSGVFPGVTTAGKGSPYPAL